MHFGDDISAIILFPQLVVLLWQRPARYKIFIYSASHTLAMGKFNALLPRAEVTSSAMPRVITTVSLSYYSKIKHIFDIIYGHFEQRITGLAYSLCRRRDIRLMPLSGDLPRFRYWPSACVGRNYNTMYRSTRHWSACRQPPIITLPSTKYHCKCTFHSTNAFWHISSKGIYYRRVSYYQQHNIEEPSRLADFAAMSG